MSRLKGALACLQEARNNLYDAMQELTVYDGDFDEDIIPRITAAHGEVENLAGILEDDLKELEE